MKANQRSHPLFLLWTFRLVALVGFIPFLINTGDIMLHIQGITLDGAMGPLNRLFLGLVIAPVILIIAVLCIRRIPNNVIGWMLVALAYGISAQVLRKDFIPLTTSVIVLNWFIIFFWLAFLTIALYFPDGQLYPSSINRWGNPVITLIILSISIISLISGRTLQTSTGLGSVEIPNPLFLLDWDYTKFTIPCTLFLMVAGIVTFIFRYRNSRAERRIQLRWFLFGLVLQGGLSIFSFVAPGELQRYTQFVTPLFGLIFPLTIGISILRYRLYEIDLIIRRTLQYGLLSVLLVLVYFGLVVLLGQAFQSATGQQSPLVIVVSTLIIAALFNPLRRRVQAWIDRRFYRQKYDAALALEEFSDAARREVALDVLSQCLTAAVQDSLQPERITLWLKNKEQKP